MRRQDEPDEFECAQAWGADALLEGDDPVAASPASAGQLAALLAAASAPGRVVELDGLEAALVAFNASVAEPATGRRLRPIVLGVAGAVAAALAVGSGAAYANVLPAPIQRFAHDVIGAPQPDEDTRPPAGGTVEDPTSAPGSLTPRGLLPPGAVVPGRAGVPTPYASDAPSGSFAVPGRTAAPSTVGGRPGSASEASGGSAVDGSGSPSGKAKASAPGQTKKAEATPPGQPKSTGKPTTGSGSSGGKPTAPPGKSGTSSNGKSSTTSTDVGAKPTLAPGKTKQAAESSIGEQTPFS